MTAHCSTLDGVVVPLFEIVTEWVATQLRIRLVPSTEESIYFGFSAATVSAGQVVSGGGAEPGVIEQGYTFTFGREGQMERKSESAHTALPLAPGSRALLLINAESLSSSLSAQASAVDVSMSDAGEISAEVITDRLKVQALAEFLKAPALRGVEEHRRKTQLVEGTEIHNEPIFSSLVVNGYRGFSAPTTLNLAQPNGKPGSGLTVLVGANNSGKSTFLEALYYLARSRWYSDISFPQPRRNHMNDLVEMQLTRSDGVSLSVRSLPTHGSQAARFWARNGEETSEEEDFEIYVTPARRVFSPYFSGYGDESRNWFQSGQEFSRTQPLDSFATRLQAVNRDPDRRVRFDALLESITGHPLPWTIDEMGEGQQFVKLLSENGWYTSEGLGEGLVSLLFIVDALYDSEPGSLIAIDEPESSLHPQLIKRLRRVLAKYSGDRQIVIATHSPWMIDWIDVRNGASIARVYKNRMTGMSELAQATHPTLKKVADLAKHRNPRTPHSVSVEACEAFFLEDGVVLTEGQEDVAYLPRVLDDLGLDPIDNFFGWGAGGVQKIPQLAQLFLELGFQQIGVILDSGTEDVAERLKPLGKKVCVGTIPASDIRNKPPIDGKPAVIGLLDKGDKSVRDEFRVEAKEVLNQVIEHTRI